MKHQFFITPSSLAHSPLTRVEETPFIPEEKYFLCVVMFYQLMLPRENWQRSHFLNVTKKLSRFLLSLSQLSYVDLFLSSTLAFYSFKGRKKNSASNVYF